MNLGQKKTYTGVVKRLILAKGSKNEHEAIVLDTGDGPALKLRVVGGNAFRNPALDRFVGYRVRVAGVAGSGVPGLFVENVSDITILGSPGRPCKPPRP